MRIRILFGLVLILLGITAVQPANATPPTQSTNDPKPITVATKDIVPFVFTDEDGVLSGFSIDLWEEITLETGIPFEWMVVETVGEQLTAVEEGTADAAIAAISMTAEREERIDFSYPYFDAGLHIMTVPRTSTSLGSLFSFFLQPRFLYSVGALILLIILIGHVVWLVERRHNKDFDASYVKGVWEGIWWAAVTVTTVGYGDHTPRAFWGRLIGLFWMFSGLFVIANFTAAVTTQLTVNELRSNIAGVDDLPGKRVVTVAESTSADWLREHGLPFRGVTAIDEAYELLENGRVDAIVYDAPVLLYKAANSDPDELIVVGDLFNRETYGVALPPNSPYEDEINRALLKLFENGTYDRLYEKWYHETRYE